MNKTLLAVGAGALFLGTGVVSAGDTKVYGRADVSYQYESYKYGADQDGKTFVLKSNASRIGVKGDKSLNDDGLSAVYQLEWEVDFTDKDSKNGDGDNILKARNSFIGLTGGFGTVVVGTHDTPLKKAQGKIDIFGDLEGDIKHLIKGENRVNNVLQYSSPKLADAVVANIAIVPGEETEDGSDVDNGVADAISASLVYKTDDLYAAFAIDDSVGGLDTIRLVGQVKVQDAKIGLLYQVSEPSEGAGDDEDGIILSASYKIGQETLKFQYGVSDMKEKGLEQVSVGIDHKLAKKTKLYAFLTNTTADDDAEEEMIVAAGIQHKF